MQVMRPPSTHAFALDKKRCVYAPAFGCHIGLIFRPNHMNQKSPFLGLQQNISKGNVTKLEALAQVGHPAFHVPKFDARIWQSRFDSVAFLETHEINQGSQVSFCMYFRGSDANQ